MLRLLMPFGISSSCSSWSCSSARLPIYEVMALAFVFIVAITGRLTSFGRPLYPSTSSLFYHFRLLVVAVIFDETKVVERSSI